MRTRLALLLGLFAAPFLIAAGRAPVADQSLEHAGAAERSEGGAPAEKTRSTQETSTAQEPVLEDEETALHKGMLVIRDASKTLRRAVRDEARDAESLELVIAMQRAALDAKLETPSMAARVPEAERDAFNTAYRAEMILFERQLLDLEDALLSGEREVIRAAYEVVRGTEDPAHERFIDE